MFSPNCSTPSWHRRCCFVSPLCLKQLAISCCQKGAMKNSKQEKNLETDRGRKYGSIATPGDAVVPRVVFTSMKSFPSNFSCRCILHQRVFSSTQCPPHLCFTISCFKSNWTRRWIISPQYLEGICQRAYTSGGCLDEFCVHTSVLSEQKASWRQMNRLTEQFALKQFQFLFRNVNCSSSVTRHSLSPGRVDEFALPTRANFAFIFFF